jgi:F-type H+-transporting ATPase subunit delta
MALGGSGPRRYAQALFDIASDEAAVGTYRQSLDRLGTALAPDVVHVLRDPRVPFARRRTALEGAAKDEPAAIRAILELLLERDRVGVVPDIARAFGDLADRREGIVKARITTAVGLDDGRRTGLVLRLEQASGKKIRATFVVDASLIGGAKVQVGDRLIDGSLRVQLDSLARQLAGQPS